MVSSIRLSEWGGHGIDAPGTLLYPATAAEVVALSIAAAGYERTSAPAGFCDGANGEQQAQRRASGALATANELRTVRRRRIGRQRAA